MHFQGQIPDQSKAVYADFILPIVWCKKSLTVAQKWLQQVIQAELIKGERVDNEVVNLIILLLFCLFSLASYRLKSYYPLILGIVGIIWFVDRTLAKRKYFNRSSHNKNLIKTSLKHNKDNSCLWRIDIPRAEPRQLKFNLSHIKWVEITNLKINGGAFAEPIASAWRTCLVLQDSTSLLIYEDTNLTDLFNKSEQLASYFNVPLVFANSEGNSQYVKPEVYSPSSQRSRFSLAKQPSMAIQIKKNASGWHIYSQWTFQHSRQFFGKVFQDSGFLLFVLFLSQFMFEFGRMLDEAIASYRAGEGVSSAISSFAFNTIKFFLSPSLSALDLAILGFAVGLMIVKGALISQVKHLYLDRDKLKIFINRREISELERADIKGALLLREPEPIILILTETQVAEVRELVHLEDYRTMLSYLEEKLAIN